LRLLVACTLAAFVMASGVPVVAAEAQLQPLAHVGPWPAVSKLIGYGGRLWFVNSVKFRNHNSADLHSYDPATGETRYETHLFSQDAGEPVVFAGRLYWPYEDPRASTGRGEFMVTDGSGRWDWRMLPYLATLAVLTYVGVASRTGSGAPGALGLPYVREDRR
jgi:outer membrane protein assembly factor BamB